MSRKLALVKEYNSIILRGADLKTRVAEGIFQVGGDGLTDTSDCCSYLILNGSPVLIDAGLYDNAAKLVSNIKDCGVGPEEIALCIVTHAHFDHFGGACYLKEKYNTRIAVHEGDLKVISEGNDARTAAVWYNVKARKLKPDTVLWGKSGVLKAGILDLNWIHTPGHTPGSISLYCDTGLYRVLFGQDIHGPFYEIFGSDIHKWLESMNELKDLNSDILCEGHHGIIMPANEVKGFIEGMMRDFRPE